MGVVVVSMTGPAVHWAEGKAAMSKGVVVLLLPVLLFLGACGNTPPPSSRSDVERGTALPPPGFNGPTSVRR